MDSPVNLLDGFIGGNTHSEKHPQVDHFANYFWGEKNQGFDVLYHNMKHGQLSVKDLQDFIKENANVEELYAKHMTKLAKQAANCSPLGTFSPLMDVLRVMTEKLSSCHMDIVLKMQDIVKELSKYFEEQKSKHKQMKEQLSGTAEALHTLQIATASVMKNKEKYNQLCIETERLRRSGAPQKDIEKADSKSKKAADEYRTYVEKHGTVREQFEQKMLKSTQEFQKTEDIHLSHLKNVLNTYILSFENASVLINQVHQEFRRQLNENTIDRLILQYSELKGTGIERPAPIYFEECDPASILSMMENDTQNNHHSSSSETTHLPAATNKPKKETSGGIFGLRRRKPKQRHDTTTNSVESKDSKDAESMGSPETKETENVDEEGYTIRPEPDISDKTSFKFSSDSDSDSDSDDIMTRKIQVRIKPIEAADSGGSDLETLNAVTKNLTLGSPSPIGTKKAFQSEMADAKKVTDSSSVSLKSEKLSNEELLKLFTKEVESTSSTTNPDATTMNSTTVLTTDPPSNNNLFEQSKISNDYYSTSKKGPAPRPPVPIPSNTISSHRSDDSLKISVSQVTVDVPPPRPPKPADSLPILLPSSNSNRPSELSLGKGENFQNDKDPSSGPAPLASSESWSSLSSAGGMGTPTQLENMQYNFSSVSRGPSPLTLSHSDTIPIAVAFIETVNAYFKGSDEARSLTKVTGEVQISFPAGITRAFTSNPNPAMLSFRIYCPNGKSITNISHDTKLLQRNCLTKDSTSSFAYDFDMASLISHVRKMTEKEPDSPYYNIHIISYQSASSYQSMPLHVTSSWKCEPTTTEIHINYKYNSASTSAVLRNLSVIVPIQGSVTNVQSTPQSIWKSGQNRLCWQLPGTLSSSAHSGSLHSMLTMSSGPSKPTTLAVQFLSDGCNLSGADFELTGTGYRTSLVKKRFITGKYLSES